MGVEHRDNIMSETVDSEGRRVVLLWRLWDGKILLEHPDMSPPEDAVMETVTKPDHVEADPVHPERKHYFARDVGPSSWLLVVVSYEQEPARIITAFARRKDPPQWSLRA